MTDKITSTELTDRPAFLPPDLEWVYCFGCGERTPAEDVVGSVDVSADDEYYPDMRPLCPRCDQ